MRGKGKDHINWSDEPKWKECEKYFMGLREEDIFKIISTGIPAKDIKGHSARIDFKAREITTIASAKIYEILSDIHDTKSSFDRVVYNVGLAAIIKVMEKSNYKQNKYFEGVCTLAKAIIISEQIETIGHFREKMPTKNNKGFHNEDIYIWKEKDIYKLWKKVVDKLEDIEELLKNQSDAIDGKDVLSERSVDGWTE